jgi:hypothetical protein
MGNKQPMCESSGVERHLCDLMNNQSPPQIKWKLYKSEKK